jgi:hypothetical protein
MIGLAAAASLFLRAGAARRTTGRDVNGYALFAW